MIAPTLPSSALFQPHWPSVGSGHTQESLSTFLLLPLPRKLWALLILQTIAGLLLQRGPLGLIVTASYLFPSQHGPQSVAAYSFVYLWTLSRVVAYPMAGVHTYVYLVPGIQ